MAAAVRRLPWAAAATAAAGAPARCRSVRHVQTQARATTLLVRDFIARSLYDEDAGYFAQIASILSPPAALPFASFRNQADYERAVGELYGRGQHTEVWHTPVEVFQWLGTRRVSQPYFAQAMATHIARHVQYQARQRPVTIVEAGGGNGTLMVGMLDHFKAVFPAVYRDLTYHLVEISPAMHTRQQQTLAASQHAALRGQQVHLHHASILTWPGPAAGPPARSTSTYLVATEVLDNLPHDKISVDDDGQVWQHLVEVRRPAGGGPTYVELQAPLADPLLRRCLDACGPDLLDGGAAGDTLSGRLQLWAHRWLQLDGGAGARTAFVPTAAMQLLERARDALGHEAHVVLADFDALPHCLPGRLGPLVQRKVVGGGTVTADTFLVPWGSSDIMFPTDFALLQRMHRAVFGRDGSRVWKQAAFLGAHCDVARAAARNGYNPLLEDYANVAVFSSF